MEIIVTWVNELPSFLLCIALPVTASLFLISMIVNKFVNRHWFD